MEKIYKRILITITIGIFLMLGFYIITEGITKYTGFMIFSDENDFEKCLKKQDINLYLNTQKLSKTLKDIQLIDNLGQVKITNCAINNKNCVENKVNFSEGNIYWIINENKVNRDINFEEFKEFSGCESV
jgi:hypothetical protein